MQDGEHNTLQALGIKGLIAMQGMVVEHHRVFNFDAIAQVHHNLTGTD
jgi:hypothetical protein